MTDEMLFKGTALISNNAYMNNMPFDRVKQTEITAEELFKEQGYDKIHLETTDYGEYFILFNAPGDPAREYYKNKRQENITLNINRILPDLIQAWKENDMALPKENEIPIQHMGMFYR